MTDVDFETHLTKYITRYNAASKDSISIDIRINNLISLLRHSSTLKFPDMDELHKILIAEHKRHMYFANYNIQVIPLRLPMAYKEDIKRISKQTPEEYINDQLRILNNGIEKSLIKTKMLVGDIVIPPLREIVIEYMDCRYIFCQMLQLKDIRHDNFGQRW